MIAVVRLQGKIGQKQAFGFAILLIQFFNDSTNQIIDCNWLFDKAAYR
jgi:hypothetical protein